MRVKQFLNWVLVAAWMGLIFFFSAQKGSTSGSLSGSIVQFIGGIWHVLFPRISLDTELVHFLIRKGAHFSVYLMLGILTANALRSHGLSVKKQILYAFLISFLYASSDEFHQSFVPGRGPSIRDVAIDSAGAAAGIGLYQWFQTVLSKKQYSSR